MKKITLTKVDIKNLFKWLNTPLHGQLMKSRHEFLKPLYEIFDSIDPKRIEIIEKYSEKNDEGKPVIEEGVFKIQEENKEKASKELSEFLGESIELEYAPVIIRDIETILLEKTIKSLDITEGKAMSEFVEKLK